MRKKWAEIHQNLEKVLTPAQVAVWISPLRPLVTQGAANASKKLILVAKNRFIADFVKNNLLGLIAEVTGEIMPGTDVQITTENELASGGSSLEPAPSDGSASPTGKKMKAATAQNVPLSAGAVFSGTPGLPDEAKDNPLSDSSCQTYSNQDRAKDFIQISSVIHKRHAECAKAGQDIPSPRVIPSPRPLPGAQLSLPLRAYEPSPSEDGGQRPEPKNWRFSFEDFVVGPCNELAYAASRSICEALPGTDVLFLSSAPGLGKTHLMHAVGQTLSAKCNRKNPRIDYLTAEEFASRFYLSIRDSETDRFKARYRNLDMLLLEDVHFLQGKEKMQAELLATIKAVHDRGGKVVFSSSFSPRDLVNMDDQLQSRLCAGLLSPIQTPDLETRKRIFRKKAALHQVFLPDDVAELLAGHIRSDVRQIESCLHNLILKARLFNCSITMNMAWEVVANYASHTPILNLDGIIKYVCQCFGISQEKLYSKSRKQEYVIARNTAFFLARKHTDLSLEAIGECFNRRHSTVLKGITNLERELSRQSPTGRQIASALDMIEKNGNLVIPQTLLEQPATMQQ